MLSAEFELTGIRTMIRVSRTVMASRFVSPPLKKLCWKIMDESAAMLLPMGARHLRA